eukprot:3259438-Rhodomonas_salina.1
MKLRRWALCQRLSLEMELMRGIRMLILCAIMFSLVIYAAVIESQGPRRLGLLSSYQSLFELDDSLAQLKTPENFFSFLRSVSETSRTVMPLSSDHFVEKGGELKLFSGTRKFRQTLLLDNEDADPRISSPSFTFTVWIRIEPGKGGTIIRKPLGTSFSESQLSCWGWHEGFPTSRFTFGAHDFGGSQSSELERTGVRYPSIEADSATAMGWVEHDRRMQVLPAYSGWSGQESAVGTHAIAVDDGKWHLVSTSPAPTTPQLESVELSDRCLLSSWIVEDAVLADGGCCQHDFCQLLPGLEAAKLCRHPPA